MTHNVICSVSPRYSTTSLDLLWFGPFSKSFSIPASGEGSIFFSIVFSNRARPALVYLGLIGNKCFRNVQHDGILFSIDWAHPLYPHGLFFNAIDFTWFGRPSDFNWFPLVSCNWNLSFFGLWYRFFVARHFLSSWMHFLRRFLYSPSSLHFPRDFSMLFIFLFLFHFRGSCTTPFTYFLLFFFSCILLHCQFFFSSFNMLVHQCLTDNLPIAFAHQSENAEWNT